MHTAWVLIFMWYTPADGLLFDEYVGPSEGVYYQTYDECFADGMDLVNKMIADGADPEAINGGCYEMVIPDEGE